MKGYSFQSLPLEQNESKIGKRKRNKNDEVGQLIMEVETEKFLKQRIVPLNQPKGTRFTPMYSDNPPWITKKNFGAYFERFNSEITDLYNYLKPTKQQVNFRKDLLKKYKKIISKACPQVTDIVMFGSSATGTFLKDSDIDLAIDAKKEESVDGSSDKQLLKKLNKKIGRFVSEKVFIRRAKVPIIKFKDTSSNIPIDLSVNNSTYIVAAVDKSRELLEKYPHLKSLMFVLKSYLASRSLNSNMTGGVGGYALLIWVASFIRIHNKLYGPIYGGLDSTTDCNIDESSAHILLNFFHFFGYCFDYSTLGLACGGFVDENVVIFDRFLLESKKGILLALLDPADKNNLIILDANRITAMCDHFRRSYCMLSSKSAAKKKSLLALILNTK